VRYAGKLFFIIPFQAIDVVQIGVDPEGGAINVSQTRGELPLPARVQGQAAHIRSSSLMVHLPVLVMTLMLMFRLRSSIHVPEMAVHS